MPTPYDALLVVSFGGPEGPDDVLPFLENVLRGKNVPRERMMEVAEHYHHFDGVSPINSQVRALIAALEPELARQDIRLPIYWGNRNWHPLLPDTLAQMAADGIQRALAFVTSAYRSYSNCRQYLENIEAARQQVGPAPPIIDKIRPFYNHPGFIEAMTDRVRDCLEQVPADERRTVPVIFTAHSIPRAMADGCDYQHDLREACTLVGRQLERHDWYLAYQSRSGPPSQPWLEPDIRDQLTQLRQTSRATHVIVVPIGFLSDHMEVVYDLDYEAAQTCQTLGFTLIRGKTAGCHPRFVTMIGELIQERLQGTPALTAAPESLPSPNVCPPGCCSYGRPPAESLRPT